MNELRKKSSTKEYYAKIFEFAGDAIFIETTDWRILDVNPAACVLFGYSSAEMIGRNMLDLAGVDINIRSLGEKFIDSGESFTIYSTCKDGSRIMADIRICSYSEKDERRLVVIARDVSKKYKDMEKIKKQNDYMLLLHEMNIEILNQQDLSGLLNKIVSQVCDLFETSDAVLHLIDETSGVLNMVVGVGKSSKLDRCSLKMGEGAAGRAALTGRPCIIENYQEWPDRVKDPVWAGIKTCASVPLKAGIKVIGVLVLDFFDEQRSFSNEDIDILCRFAEVVSIALVKAELQASLEKSESQLQLKVNQLKAANEELQASEKELRLQYETLHKNDEEMHRRNKVLDLLNKTALGLMQKIDLNEVLSTIIGSASELFDTPAYVLLIDEDNNVVEIKVEIGHENIFTGYKFEMGKGLCGYVAKTGMSLVIEDYQNWPGRYPSDNWKDLQSCVGVPLKAGEKVIGVLNLDFYYKRSFSADDLEILTRLAELAAIAIYDANLLADYKREIEERKITEDALRKSENSYRILSEEIQEKQALLTSLINSIPDLIFYKDVNGVYLGCNKAFEIFAGCSYINLIGLRDTDIFRDKVMAESFMKMDEDMLKKRETQRYEELVTYPDGKKVYLDTVKTPYFSHLGKIAGLIGVSRDITERKQKEDEIIYLSMHDALTGLYNRAFFEEEMKRIESVRGVAAGIIVCDVDGLKIINDTLGHQTGDRILKAVARILKASFRPGDMVARIGGDEIAVLVTHNSSKVLEADCHSIKEKMEAFNVMNPTTPISLSMGFAVSRGRSVDMTALFKEADNNMYREKLHRDKSNRSAIVQTLMKALEARDFQTEGHSDRLEKLMEAFAKTLDLPEQSIADLRLLARFHDIGKVGIPDSILFKAGKLTKDETAVMRQHCDIGYRIALTAPDLSPIADWVLKHQEWWNGKGYPLGLKGEEIPIACRMLSIVDAYDAMVSDRPYRRAMSREAAVAELNKCAGTQFDPDLVRRFLDACIGQ